jgi:hypothetical protein
MFSDIYATGLCVCLKSTTLEAASNDIRFIFKCENESAYSESEMGSHLLSMVTSLPYIFSFRKRLKIKRKITENKLVWLRIGSSGVLW